MTGCHCLIALYREVHKVSTRVLLANAAVSMVVCSCLWLEKEIGESPTRTG